MKKYSLALCAAVAALACHPTFADEPTEVTSRYGGAGLRFGTGGLAVDYTYGINRYVDIRAGYHFGSISGDTDEDDITYDAKLKFSALNAMLDVKPFGGGFRVSLGLYSAAPEITLEASGLDDYELGERTYTGDLKLDGDIDLGATAPYLGIGWGGTTNAKGFGMSFDAGVMFTQSPDIRLDAYGNACDSTLAACDPNGPTGFDVNGDSAAAQQFQAEKEQEISNLEDDTKDYKLWPVIMIGFHYRF